MDNLSLDAKGLLLGKSNDLIVEFIKKKFYEKIDFYDKLKDIEFNRDTSTWVYENVSDIMLELYQNLGIDMYFDNIDVLGSYISFVAKYVDDNDEVEIKISY